MEKAGARRYSVVNGRTQREDSLDNGARIASGNFETAAQLHHALAHSGDSHAEFTTALLLFSLRRGYALSFISNGEEHLVLLQTKLNARLPTPGLTVNIVKSFLHDG